MTLLNLVVIVLFYAPVVASNDILNAPPSFDFGKNVRAVFVDFKEAFYDFKVETKNKIVKINTYILFESYEIGYPIFDFVKGKINSVKIDGQDTSESILTSPKIKYPLKNGPKNTTYRIINKMIDPGLHELLISVEYGEEIRLNNPTIEFDQQSVNYLFWTSDLEDRKYLEKFVPANLEYDHYKMRFKIVVDDKTVPHVIFSNGKIKNINLNEWEIDFPEYFTSASLFFHLGPLNQFEIEKFEQKSRYKSIPVIIYGKKDAIDLLKYKMKTNEILTDLESKFGPFMHPSVTIYGNGIGGMEYCGATITSIFSLKHELTHSFFGRGVMPSDGDSGWIDEAITTWHDYANANESIIENLNLRMGNHSPYNRMTDTNAYYSGKNLMGHFYFLMKNDWFNLLRKFVEKFPLQSITNLQFENYLKDTIGMELPKRFKEYVYGSGQYIENKISKYKSIHHPVRTTQQVRDLY